MCAYQMLFTPGRLGRRETKNRLVMAPMVRNYADTQGGVTPKYQAHITRIARGGVGTMILEASYITPDGKGFSNQLGIHEDSLIPGLRSLVDIAHQHGALIGPQLYHAGRQTSAAVTGTPPVAPSALPDPTINEVPHALTTAEIHHIIEAFAQGARRAKEAGCDFVEIHGAHGYLITQFLSAYSNARTDEYGGDLEERLRFLVEVVEAVRGAVGLDFPISVRLSAEEQVPGGLTLPDTLYIAKRLEALRVDALHISAGNYASYERGYMISPMAIADGPLIPLARAVKEVVRIPVIAVDKIRHPGLAELTLIEGQADFIGLGRVLLADPEWPNKAANGREEEIDKCIACNQGCIGRLFDNLDVWCTVNPQTSRELIYDAAAPGEPKHVVIAGGGPAGMSAAQTAAEYGHRVTLFEELDHLGGQLLAAAAAPHRPGWAELRQYQEGAMRRLDIDVRLETALTAEMAVHEGADTVIIATGATPIRLKIPGAEGANVITARDLLEGKAEARGRVVVAGGGCAGAQTAEYLAVRGHEVIIAEMMGAIAVDAPRAERELLLARLQQLGVQIQIETKIMRVEEGRVIVERPTGEDSIPADTVVVCLGSTANDSLADALVRKVPEVILVGDARRPRKVTEAIAEGALAGLACGDARKALGKQQQAA